MLFLVVTPSIYTMTLGGKFIQEPPGFWRARQYWRWKMSQSHRNPSPGIWKWGKYWWWLLLKLCSCRIQLPLQHLHLDIWLHGQNSSWFQNMPVPLYPIAQHMAFLFAHLVKAQIIGIILGFSYSLIHHIQSISKSCLLHLLKNSTIQSLLSISAVNYCWRRHQSLSSELL